MIFQASCGNEIWLNVTMSRFNFLCLLAIFTTFFALVFNKQGRKATSIKHHVSAKKDFIMWLDTHDLTRHSHQSRESSLKNIDKLSLSYLKATSSKSHKRRNIKKFERDLAFSDADYYEHALYPYFLELSHSTESSNYKKQSQHLGMLLQDPAGLSCHAYRYIHEHLSNRRLVNIQSKKTSRMLQELVRSNNYDKVKGTMTLFLNALPHKKIPIYMDEIRQLCIKFPELNEDLGHHLSFVRPRGKLAEISSFISRRYCNAARKNLIRFLYEQPAKTLLPNIKFKVNGILDCYQGHPNATKIWALKTLINPMNKAFGDSGRSFIRLLIAERYWRVNHLRTASWIVNDVLQSKAVHGNYDVQADAHYLLARIDENKKNHKKAQDRFELIVKRFPNYHKGYDVKKTLLFNYIGLEQWEEAYILSSNIAHQSQGISKFSIPHLEIFLFWAGQSAVELGKKREAVKYWKYAASDFYSTYYGGLSHYMVERYTGKKFFPQLLVSSSPSFQSFKSSFSVPTLIRIERIEALLRLGLREKALCEIGELGDPSEDSGKLQPMKALLLHASGQWLEAIKIYREVPREVRSRLPYGFEKILFPKRYDENIEYYASKSGVDPDLVFSIIRQESVFDPKAFSGAGARGLMQLMRRTARFEAAQLKNSYVSIQKKQRLMRNSRYSASLFDIETNIILGTHYLDRLLERFRDIPTSLAAYNAGPTVSHKWEKQVDTDNPLYFIERIPYEETRNYVKLILRNYFYYKKWYGGGSERLPYFDHLF